MKIRETIEELLQAKEGESYQFKEAKNRFDFADACKCCCALSNLGGGKLVFGISDRRPRKVVGSNAFEQPERTRLGFIERLHVMVDFELYDPDGDRVLVFDVAGRPAGLPIQYEGIAWWYEGDKLTKMSEETRRAIYAETGHDFSSDLCAAATMDDINTEAVEGFRSKWIKRIKPYTDKTGLLSRLESIDVEQLLRDIGAITDGGITYAALVLFGTAAALNRYLAQSEVIFEYRPSSRPGPAAAREEFRVGFFSFFDKLWELVNLRNDKLHYQDGFFVFDIPAYNERVVREAILNAVSHRDYQLSGSVFVKQYRDRLEIDSPGGFPHGITRENIMFRQAPRNRLIAEILARCGLVERAGQGMDLIYELCIREAKELPDFLDSDEYIVRIRLEGSKIDEKMLALFRSIGESVTDQLSTEELLIIYSLYHGQKVDANLTRYIPRLLELGIVKQDAHGGYGLNGVSLASIDETRMKQKMKQENKNETSLNEDWNAALNKAELKKVLPLLEFLKKQGDASPNELLEALGKSKTTIWRYLNLLCERGIIASTGNTSSVTYHLINTRRSTVPQ
ncbi:MAG: winged helix-turn-helix transcriptional regulator [Peptococcaceae bacterium]|jgi:ATP-dependent DNA helicase RecG|nr:winged helix-turn-helix transcriptional regulator [Peptococcaceae bacterium]